MNSTALTFLYPNDFFVQKCRIRVRESRANKFDVSRTFLESEKVKFNGFNINCNFVSCEHWLNYLIAICSNGWRTCWKENSAKSRWICYWKTQSWKSSSKSNTNGMNHFYDLFLLFTSFYTDFFPIFLIISQDGRTVWTVIRFNRRSEINFGYVPDLSTLWITHHKSFVALHMRFPVSNDSLFCHFLTSNRFLRLFYSMFSCWLRFLFWLFLLLYCLSFIFFLLCFLFRFFFNFVVYFLFLVWRLNCSPLSFFISTYTFPPIECRMTLVINTHLFFSYWITGKPTAVHWKISGRKFNRKWLHTKRNACQSCCSFWIRMNRRWIWCVTTVISLL